MGSVYHKDISHQRLLYVVRDAQIAILAVAVAPPTRPKTRPTAGLEPLSRSFLRSPLQRQEFSKPDGVAKHHDIVSGNQGEPLAAFFQLIRRVGCQFVVVVGGGVSLMVPNLKLAVNRFGGGVIENLHLISFTGLLHSRRPVEVRVAAMTTVTMTLCLGWGGFHGQRHGQCS